MQNTYFAKCGSPGTQTIPVSLATQWAETNCQNSSAPSDGP